MSDRPNDLVRSVSRAFRVLEEVAARPAPMTVKAIARRCQLNLSTTYHLVRTLAYEGYLLRQADGCYVLGDGVALRYRDLLSSFRQPPEVHRVLQHLSATTRRTAYLGRVVEGRILITDLVEGPDSPILEDLELGLPVAAHATAIGKALLASMPKPRRIAYLADQGLRPFTPRTPTALEALERDLVRIRSRGEVSEHGEFRDGVACMGALVHRADDDWWALVVSTRGEEVPEQVARSVQLARADLDRGAPAAGLPYPT